jgi:predicted O-methyltransferase YrrM
MSRQNLLQGISSEYREFINNCEPEIVTAPRVEALLATARAYLAGDGGGRDGADALKTRVHLRNAAQTLLVRAVWLTGETRQSLLSFIGEQPEFIGDGEYKFTYDSFSWNIERWQKDLGHLAGQTHLSFLEVGSFEGKSACWLLQNILTHETSRITCVDVFEEEKSQGLYDTTGLDSASMSRKDRFDHNIRQTGASHRVETIVGRSQEALRALPLASYDFIYIDGSHVARDVLTDIILAWQLLKAGGIITLDDYLWHDHPDPLSCPQIAIDAFLTVFKGHYRVIHSGYQVTLAKPS